MSQLWLHKLPPAPPRSPFSTPSARLTQSDPSSLSASTSGSTSSSSPISSHLACGHCRNGGGTSGSGVGSTTQDSTEKVEARLSAIEGQLGKILEELQELKQAHVKKNFLIKGTATEEGLRDATATLFCETITRQPDDESIKNILVQVMGPSILIDKKKYDTAFRYCRSKLASYRSEERRKVLGKNPHTKCAQMSTKELAASFMKSIHADTAVIDTYERHLAILRQFVRCCYDSKQVNYTEFVKWLDEYYPSRSETDWIGIMEEDSVFNYQHGNGLFQNEVSVSIESTGSQ
ncbi:hypothetical protein EMCRGX_G004259 [Ephydatia muelleri]|eukprot:Em0007g254a